MSRREQNHADELAIDSASASLMVSHRRPYLESGRDIRRLEVESILRYIGPNLESFLEALRQLVVQRHDVG